MRESKQETATSWWPESEREMQALGDIADAALREVGIDLGVHWADDSFGMDGGYPPEWEPTIDKALDLAWQTVKNCRNER